MKNKKPVIQGTHIALDDSNPLANFTILNSIGEGTFGKVHLSIHNLTKEKVAVKILEKAKILETDEIERINREIKFLKKFKNINIIKIYEIIETKSNVYFIMEHASGGELFNYIVKNKRLEEKEASFFFSQIVHALDFIHKQGIVHRDIKPENMLLTENKTIKLIDFGLSNQFTKGALLKTPCGSPCYAAPEMILGRKYQGTQIDLWSLGITLYAMVCGYLPFEDKNNDKLYKKILDCKIDFPNFVSDQARDIILKLLAVNPNKRIGFDQIKQHPFYKLSTGMIDKSNFGLYLNKVDNSILNKMAEMGFDKEKVMQEVESNNHNNITTTYELLLNKFKGSSEVVLRNSIPKKLSTKYLPVSGNSKQEKEINDIIQKAIENSPEKKSLKHELKFQVIDTQPIKKEELNSSKQQPS